MERAWVVTRLIARFPDIIDHGTPLTGSRLTPFGDYWPAHGVQNFFFSHEARTAARGTWVSSIGLTRV